MIVVVYGTRPEAIKLAPLVKVLRARKEKVFVIFTNQHRDLVAYKMLPWDLDLNARVENGDVDLFVSSVLEQLNVWFRSAKNVSVVVVQGDTSTAFAAATSAFLRQIPVAHVEAGLRTNRLDSPFPEEGFRQMIDRMATRMYAPTNRNALALIREGRDPSSVVVTGNTGIDAALEIAKFPSVSLGMVTPGFEKPYVLATLHRREALGRPLQSVCGALLRVVNETALHVVIPLHPNPKVRETVTSILGNHPKISLCEALSYAVLVTVMLGAECVLTDSGGIQEEAPTLGVPVLVAREVTEREEAVEAGSAILVGFDEEKIFREIVRLHADPVARAFMATPRPVFGDGSASERIADDLLASF